MKNFKKFTMPTFITRCLTVTLSALLAFALVACGGGGVVPSGGVQQRALSADFGTRKAVSYSPFRTANRDTEVVTAANVLADLQLLQTG